MKTWKSFSNINWEYSAIMLWESAGIYPQENKEHRQDVSSHLAFWESMPSSQAKPSIIPSNHFYLGFLKGKPDEADVNWLSSHLTILETFLRQYSQSRWFNMGLLDPQLHQEPTELALAKPLSMETKEEAHEGT